MQKGFSIIELVIVIGLFAGILLIITGFSQGTLKFKLTFNESLQVQYELESTLRNLVTEIRSISQSNTGSYPIAAATTSSLTFYADIDKDGLLERVRYFLQGTTFRRGSIKPAGNPLTYTTSSEIIVDKIKNVIATSTPIFSYFNSAYTGSQAAMSYPIDVSLIRVIKATVTANQTSDTISPAPVTFVIEATMRNLRSNL